MAQRKPLMTSPYYQNEELGRALKQITFHPDYLKELLGTQNFLMNGDGPLPFAYRHYIAIMAASRHQCRCLINYHKQRFLALEGNIQWLQGLQFTPKKLKNLNEINILLAHSPWTLKRCHIEKLMKGKDNWSVGELCQAMVLLAHFHCLCSFIYSCQILDPVEDCTDASNHLISDEDSFEEVNQETVEQLMEKMSLLQKLEKESSEEEKEYGNPYELDPSCTDSQNDCDMDNNDENSSSNNNCNSEDKHEFEIQDWKWDDHAYSLLNEYYSDVGTVLDEKFKVAYDLTYYTMGHKENVDTTIFRRAVWNFIHKVFGIIHDDYNYFEMEDLLDKGFRNYAETVCFRPENITKDAHDEIMRAFRHSEKVHVNLMLFEARMQAELLYAVSAMMHYMT